MTKIIDIQLKSQNKSYQRTKTKKNLSILVLLIVVVVGIMCAGCTSNDSSSVEPIVGTWKYSDNPYYTGYLEFHSDGKYTYTLDTFGEIVSYTSNWIKVGNNHYLSLSTKSNPDEFYVSDDGKEIIHRWVTTDNSKTYNLVYRKYDSIPVPTPTVKPKVTVTKTPTPTVKPTVISTSTVKPTVTSTPSGVRLYGQPESIGESNALQSAKQYLKYSPYSRSELIERLEDDGYTQDEVLFGVDNCGANWNEQAAKSAKQYLKYSSYSRSGLIERLEDDGFTHEQAVYGVTEVGY